MPAPPNRRPDPAAHLALLYTNLIPDAVRKAISADELNDRLIEAARLGAQASDPAVSADLRKAAKLRSQAILRAQPRAVTTRQHQALIAKAAAAPPAQAAAIRRDAEQLIEEKHPIAPTRAQRVRKAKAEDEAEQPVAVFDQDGTMIGIADPSDITPVTGKQATPSAPAAQAGEPVAKAQRLSVWDQRGHRYETTRGKIRKTAEPRPGVYDDGPLRRVLGDDDDTGWGTGVESPASQARRGPVMAGGTTGLGMPRRTGPAAALPGEGPQAARPGDVEARTIIKSLGPQWRCLYDSAGRLRGAVQQQDIRPARPGHVLKGAAALAYTAVCNSAGRQVGIAPAAGIIPLADLRTAGRVAKSIGRR
ncbi:MAG TPA: hypothetical protein VFB06_29495 [Streptosporangiaceae bacterium]|nr:hypothetical protein [Streptosporangiaceae bacterium]